MRPVVNRFSRRRGMYDTSASLLERLRHPNEQAAWERFVRLYTPVLLAWSRRLGLGADDAADLCQDVFARVFQALPGFAYDPSRRFRGWLWRDPGTSSCRTQILAELSDLSIYGCLLRFKRFNGEFDQAVGHRWVPHGFEIVETSQKA